MKLLQLCTIGVLIVIVYFLWPTKTPIKKSEEFLPSINLESWEPITLKSSNGQSVEIVAVHEVSPQGLTFSPTPSSPLIGSNKLERITTSWSNIDPISMSPYRELYSAYERALKGERVTLKIGAHFYQVEDALRAIRAIKPKIRVHYSDGSSNNYNFSSAKRSTLSTPISGWSMSNANKSSVIEAWSETREKLKWLLYRKDVILFVNKLDRGIRAVDSIQPESRVFNISAAKDIYELVGSQ